jgi:hypothetical protein
MAVYTYYLWGSSDGIASGYGLDGRGVGVRSLAGVRDFSLLHSVQTGSGAQPASYAVGTGALSPEVKQSESECDHPRPYSAEIKNSGAIPPPPYISLWRGV